MDEKKAPRNFDNFKLKVTRSSKRPLSPLSAGVYYRWGTRSDRAVSEDFTLEAIFNIIRSGDIESARVLSRYFYRTNSLYRNNVDFLAALPLYDTVVIPVSENEKGSKVQIIKSFDNACSFVENLDVPNTFNHISKEWIKTGVYNGILRTDGEKVIIQDLPFQGF